MPEQDLCPSLQQCQKRAVRWPGTWRLAPKRAISLMPRKPSQILIVQGCAWITWEVTDGHATALSDRFLMAGESMDVPAGVRLVMESVQSNQAVDFDWRAMPDGLRHRPAQALPSLSALTRNWVLAWLQLGKVSGQLLRGLVWQGLRGSPKPECPGPVV